MTNRIFILSISCLLINCRGVKNLGDGAYLAKYDAEKGSTNL